MLGDALKQDDVVNTLWTLVGCNQPVLELRSACRATGMNERILRTAAEYKLNTTFNAAALGAADASEIKDAIELADCIGAEDAMNRGRMFYRSMVLQQLQATMDAGPNASHQELSLAIDAALDAGIPDEELAEAQAQLDVMEKGRQVAQRKLRAAAAWVNVTNTEKLRAAITEAEHLGVDAKEIE